MKYKKFTTEKDALDFSVNECVIRNCGLTTKYWYCVREAKDGWYSIIDDDAKVEGATDAQPEWKVTVAK
jgi:hypothetical protein